MPLLSSLLALAAACRLAPAVPAAKATPEVVRSVVSLPLDNAERARIVNGAWEWRTAIFADGALVDRRALFLAFGQDTAYTSQLAPEVRSSLAGDTTDYEMQPRRPAGTRYWSVSQIELESPTRARLVARTSYDPREHFETIRLVRADVRGASGWSIVDVRIDRFISY